MGLITPRMLLWWKLSLLDFIGRVGADAPGKTNTVDDLLDVQTFHFGVDVQFVEVADAQCYDRPCIAAQASAVSTTLSIS